MTIGSLLCGWGVVVAAVAVACLVCWWWTRRVLGREDVLALGVADRVWSEATPGEAGVAVTVIYVSFVAGGALVLRASPGQRVTLDVRPSVRR